MKKGLHGFTLIEMLIVITIIGILASALVPRIMGAQDRAKNAKVVIDMNVILNSIYTARSENGGKRLLDITGTSRTSNGCSIGDTRNISTGSLCYTNWVTTVTRIFSYTSVATGNFIRDPRGSPYQLDENDGEMLNNGGCYPDQFSSNGADGASGQWAGGQVGVPTKSTLSDDIYVSIPKLPQYICG